MIPYGKQDISDADVQAVVDVLRSEYLTQGPVVPAFERKVAGYCGTQHAVAVNSATSALHLACLALGVGPGDSVWTSPITFVASANCARYCGAEIDFVDIDPLSNNLSVTHLREKLKQAKNCGKLPKVVIPVHLSGLSCEMEAIYDLSQQYGFKIIEDASHAIGGRYKQAPIGNCRYSDITVFSFHPVKIITTGEGGMLLTNDTEMANRITRLRSHGVTRDPSEMTHSPDGPWYYQQIELGFNYRMTDIQAALGLSQMQRLDEFVAKRQTIAERYNKLLENLPLTTPSVLSDNYSARHLYIIRLNLRELKSSHKEIFVSLRNAGIGVNLHYIPIYRQPYYAASGFSHRAYPESERYYAEAISLPMYPTLSEEQQLEVVKCIFTAIGHKMQI